MSDSVIWGLFFVIGIYFVAENLVLRASRWSRVLYGG